MLYTYLGRTVENKCGHKVVSPNKAERKIATIGAIIRVESSNNDSAYNANEDAVGCLQIRQTMVNDVNRILKRQGKIVISY